MPAKKRKWTRGMGAVDAGSLTSAQRQTLRRRQSRSRRRSQRVVVPRDKLGFPTSMVSTLRYVDRKEFNPSGTTTQAWSYRANGIYDPDEATGGEQPRGFSEYKELYNTFTVTSSKISVNWMLEGYDGPSETGGTPAALIKTFSDSTNAPAVPPVICGIMRSADGYGSGIPVNEQMEHDRTNWKVMTPNTGAEITSTKTNFVEFFGKQDLVAADGYSGTASSDPENLAHYHVWCARGADDYPIGIVKVVAFVTIEFRVTWTEPKPLADS